MVVFPFLTLHAGNVGKALPELGIESISNPVPYSKGKPLLLEFWATWCGPCRQTIPHLNKIYAAYKDKGLIVLGLTEESSEKALAFMKGVPMDYSVARDNRGRLSREFKIDSIPHSMLVDGSGIIVWEGHPGNLSSAVIDRYLGASMSGTASGSASQPAAAPATPVIRPKQAF